MEGDWGWNESGMDQCRTNVKLLPTRLSTSKGRKTAYNKRVASKIEVADWQLKVTVPGTEPKWVAFDRRL